MTTSLQKSKTFELVDNAKLKQTNLKKEISDSSLTSEESGISTTSFMGPTTTKMLNENDSKNNLQRSISLPQRQNPRKKPLSRQISQITNEKRDRMKSWLQQQEEKFPIYKMFKM